LSNDDEIYETHEDKNILSYEEYRDKNIREINPSDIRYNINDFL